jgi:putative peptidoglycan lipid II flippase
MSSFLLRSSVMIMAMTLVARIIGFVRETLLANQFGVTIETDAYKVAFSIPQTLFLFVPGALNAIFLTSLKGLLTEKRSAEAEKLFRQMLTLVTFLYLFIAIAGYMLAEPITRLIAPSYAGAELAMTVQMMRIMWPSAVFIAWIGLFQAALNAHEDFFWPMLSGVVNSVVVIAAYPLLVPHFGIQGVAIGTTAGFAVAALIMVLPLRRHRYTFGVNIHWNNPEMRSIGERFVPIMVGSSVTQLTIFLEKFLVTPLGEGKVSSLTYANTFFQLPMSIFVSAFALPILPQLVEYNKKKDYDGMKDAIESALQYLLILTVPTTAAMMVIPDALLSLVFQWGESSQFDTNAVRSTGYALFFYSIGLFFLAGRDLFTRAFYAMENTKLPVIAATVSIGFFFVLGKLLTPLFDHGAIALGASLSAVINMLLLGWLLRRRIGAALTVRFWLSLIRSCIAALWMAALIRGVLHLWDLTDVHWIVQKLIITLMIVVGAVVYGLSMIVLREPKVKALAMAVKAKVYRGDA